MSVSPASTPISAQIRTQKLGSSVSVFGSKYAIIGVHAEKVEHFVNHVAILAEPSSLSFGTKVKVWHVGPPIIAAGSANEAAGSEFSPTACDAHVIGDIVLDEGECNAILTWMRGIRPEHRGTRLDFGVYTVCPHVTYEVSEIGKRLGPRRFSCSGFVIEAYRAARLELIDTNRLPLVGENEVAAAFPGLVWIESLDEERHAKYRFKGREDLGLSGQGPWPIALPGYLLQSTVRATDATPRPNAIVLDSVAQARFPMVVQTPESIQDAQQSTNASQ